MAAKAKRRRGGLTKPNPKVNEALAPGPRDPASWGSPDPLPAGKTRRLMAPIWERMLDDSRYPWFTAEMKQAGDEIERIFVTVSGGLMPRSQMGAMVAGGGSSGAQLSEGLTIAWRDRYKPWAAEMAALRVNTGKPVMAFIIDLVMEDFTIRECEAHNGVRRGDGADLIRYGLTRYVEIAGWTRRSERRRA